MAQAIYEPQAGAGAALHGDDRLDQASARRLKIAQVCTIGMTAHVLLRDQIGLLRRMGHEVVVICSDGAYTQKLRDAGFRVECVAFRRALSPLADLAAFIALLRLCRREKFDIVHSHTPKAGLLAPLAARLSGTPRTIHTVHGLLFHDRMPAWRRGIFRVAEKLSTAFCDVVLFQSSEDAQVASQTGLCRQSKIVFLGNGIDLPKFASCVGVRSTARARYRFGEDDFVVGAVGRLVREKGFEELFAAWERLRAKYPAVKLLIVGPEEPERADAIASSRITQLRNQGAVFAGWVDDVAPCYSAMDVFALPSHREGVPRSCIEAAAAGKAVIASDIRGCREVVLHGKTGLLVPLRDPVALAGAIEKLMLDVKARDCMAVRGREHVHNNFDQAAVHAKLAGIYQAVAAELNTK